MNLILNEPCGVDAFFRGGGKGSAQVVADRISEQLRNPSQLKRTDGTDSGYPVSIIGLNGCWGSGKSNVIELVKQNFSGSKDQANFVFFEYDLWGHRLDLTRKMFLEELIDFLCDEKSDVDAEFKGDVKKLTGKTVEREHVDMLSVPAIICVLGFLSLPFLQLAADLFKERFAGTFHWVALVVSFAIWGCLVLDLSRRRTLKDAFSRVMSVARGVSPSSIDFEHEIEAISTDDLTKEQIIANGEKEVRVILEDIEKNEAAIGSKIFGSYEETSIVGDCVCGGKLLKKYSPKTKGNFIGCSNFPNCRNIYSLPKGARILKKTCPTCGLPMISFGKPVQHACLDTNCGKKVSRRQAPEVVGECPECGRDLLKRSGRYGEFVGCSGFPSCRFTCSMDDLKNLESKKNNSDKK